MNGFACTFFPDYAAVTKTEETLTLAGLAERIRNTSAPSKDALPWLKSARFGNLPSPKKSLRWNGNVLRLSGVVADYDAEQISPEDAAGKLDKAGVIGLIYTSPSHMLGHGPRWRVICPFTREMPPDRHYQMIARLNGIFDGALAPESFTLSQSYYYGSVNSNPEHRVIVVDGMMTLERCDELDEFAIGKPNGDGKAHPSGNPEAPITDIRAALAVIPNPVPSWGSQASWIEWNNLGMAVWRASGGSDDGFEEFDKWSSKSPKYDEEETAFRWRHYFESPPNGIGFGSLVHWARETQPDWQPPSNRFRNRGDADADWVIDPALLSGTTSLARDIPEPDFILGEVLSSTTRMELIGPTGIGKSNFLLAKVMAAADGRDFLHWRGCGQPRRILFIDGEMSRRLAKRRITAATRRHGGMPPMFFYFNTEDFPDFQPLNTGAGQKFVDQTIDRLGGIDLVILDNIQALLTGDMKDEEPWQQTLPWVRSLTRRNIGQIWVHHTGHDETHGYGTKTREWQLDTVGLMERIEPPDADIAFKLTFSKARERTPDNRADFEPAVITLAGDTWVSEKGRILVRGTRTTGVDLAREVLSDEIARGNGKIPPSSTRIPPDTLCITMAQWRTAYEPRSAAETKEAATRAFDRAAKDLVEKKKTVGKFNDWVWPVR